MGAVPGSNEDLGGDQYHLITPPPGDPAPPAGLVTAVSAIREAGWLTAGKLELRIGAELPLRDAADAHRALEGRQTTGKVLLIP